MKKMNDYIITHHTNMILPFTEGDKIYSKVIESDEAFIVTRKPSNIVNRSCAHYGSSADERRTHAKKMIGSKSMTPILINPLQLNLFFPSEGPRNNSVIWFSSLFLEKNRTEDALKYLDETHLSTISLDKIERQQLKCINYRSKLKASMITF